jgi:phage/plasmid primase-like uncharacterized protein
MLQKFFASFAPELCALCVKPEKHDNTPIPQKGRQDRFRFPGPEDLSRRGANRYKYL